MGRRWSCARTFPCDKFQEEERAAAEIAFDPMDGFLEALLTATLEPLLSVLGTIAQSLGEMLLGLLWGLLEGLLEVALDFVFREVVGPFLLFLGHGFWNLFRYGIVVPIFWVLCTPVVLAWALSGPGRSAEKVFSGYRAIRDGVVHPGRWWQ